MPNSIGDFLQVEFRITSAEFRVCGRERTVGSPRVDASLSAHCRIHFSRWPPGLDSETSWPPLEDHNVSSATSELSNLPRTGP